MDYAVHDIRAEMERMGGLTQGTERAMQHSFRIADPHLTDYFLRQVRSHAPGAMRYFQEQGGGA